MSSFSKSNRGYKFLLTVIDVYSKYRWIVPLKNKTDKEERWQICSKLKYRVDCGQIKAQNSIISMSEECWMHIMSPCIPRRMKKSPAELNDGIGL